MNKKEKLELAKWAVMQAKHAGADDISVDVANSREIEIEFRDKKIDKLQESTQNGLTLRVYYQGRYSSNNTNDMRRDSMAKFISESVAMTKYLGEDPFRSLPDPEYYKGFKEMDLKICDNSYDEISADKRVKLARDIEDDTRSRTDKALACTSYFSDGQYESVKVHSNGFEGVRRSTSFSAGVEITIDDGQGGRPNAFDWRTTRFFKDLPSVPTYGEFAVGRAMDQIGQSKIESGSYDVIIENRARASLLGALQGPLGGRNLQQKNSCFEGKLDEKIFSDKLTVVDDPFIEGALGSRLYDDDGLPTKRRVIIDKGVLKSFLIGWYYSRKLGVEPTGSSTTNVTFELGTRSLDEMVKGMQKGILITGFIGGNSNSTTGDYSYGIRGHYVEDGKLIKPINEMNVSGNIIDTWSKLVEVGNDPYMYSSLRRPSMYFKDISVSGV